MQSNEEVKTTIAKPSESYSHAIRINVWDAQLNWTIKNFSRLEQKNGPVISEVFSPAIYDAMKWRLKVFPYGDEHVEHGEFVSVIIELFSCDRTAFGLDFKLSVLNKHNLDACFRTISLKIPCEQGYCGDYHDYVERDYLLDPANGLLLEDSLRLVCKVRTSTRQLDCARQSADASREKLANDFLKLLNGASFSDLTVEARGGVKFAAHRNVLAARSSVLAAILNGESVEESRQDVMEIQENVMENQKDAMEIQENRMENQKNVMEIQENRMENQKNGMEIQESRMKNQKNVMEIEENIKEIIQESTKEVSQENTKERQENTKEISQENTKEVSQDENMEENQENVLRINEEPEIVKAMLEYLYTGRVEDIEAKAVKLIKAAHYFDLNDLQAQCETVLCEQLTVKKAADCLLLARLYDAEDLERKTLVFIKDHMDKVLKSEEFRALDKKYPELTNDVIIWSVSLQLNAKDEVPGPLSNPVYLTHLTDEVLDRWLEEDWA